MTSPFTVDPTASALLEQSGLFLFDSAETRVVRDFASSTRLQQLGLELDPGSVTQTSDLLHLAAAEYAVGRSCAEAGLGVSPPQRSAPVYVTEADAVLGVLKYNCNLIDGCAARLASDFRPDDFSVFASDVRRLESFNLSWTAVTQDRQQLYYYVSQLERVHFSQGYSVASAAASTGLIRLQGVLWAMRLAIMGQPDYVTGLEQVLRDAREILGI